MSEEVAPVSTRQSYVCPPTVSVKRGFPPGPLLSGIVSPVKGIFELIGLASSHCISGSD